MTNTTKADADRFIADRAGAPAPASAGVDDAALIERLRAYVRGNLEERWWTASYAWKAADRLESLLAHTAALEQRVKELEGALRELHNAVIGISPHTGAEFTDESVGAWQRLNDAQVEARSALAPPTAQGGE